MTGIQVYRGADGNLVYSITNAKNTAIGSVGTVTGDVKFSIGATTDSSDETVFMLVQDNENANLDFKAKDSFNNYELSGSNINADFNASSSNVYNVLMDTKNSTFNSSGSTNGVVLQTSAESENNLIKLGTSASNILSQKAADGTQFSFKNYVDDAGSNNTIDATAAGATLFQTESTSNGVIVDAGNTTNMFIVGGQNGVFSGGSGTDYFASESTSSGNIMSGNAGADVLYESGSKNLFMGGAGYDSATMQGSKSIANLGFNEAGYAYYGNGSYRSAVFTGSSATDSLKNVYNYAEIMKASGWTLEQFLEKSGIDQNPNYSSIKSELEKIFQY